MFVTEGLPKKEVLGSPRVRFFLKNALGETHSYFECKFRQQQIRLLVSSATIPTIIAVVAGVVAGVFYCTCLFHMLSTCVEIRPDVVVKAGAVSSFANIGACGMHETRTG